MSGMGQAMSVLTSRASVSWYTPPSTIELARSVLGTIDLDPASSELPQTWIKAARYYTKEDDALTREWDRADTVWLNPPFDDTAKWVTRLVREYESGNVQKAILLVSSNLGYRWYENLWVRYPVCLARERIRFIKPDGTQGGQSKRGQTFVFLGPSNYEGWGKFIEVFSKIGRVILP